MVRLLINISPSNFFQKMLLIEKYYLNCQACFGRYKCEWVNKNTKKTIGHREGLLWQIFIEMVQKNNPNVTLSDPSYGRYVLARESHFMLE